MEQRIGRIASVNVSPAGVPKLPIIGAWVGSLGLAGDGHAEPAPSHGGPSKAVSLYSVESIARVAADGHIAFPGAYGENLTLEGIELGSLAAGDRLAIGHGGLLIELTEHAAPCQTIAHWFAERRIARISPKLYPEDSRWYARVLAEGPVAAGDLVRPVRGDPRREQPDEPAYEPSVRPVSV
jgi:MOSC domain-containing protein YiiM